MGRIAALVPEFAVKDLPLGRTLMIFLRFRIHNRKIIIPYQIIWKFKNSTKINPRGLLV